MHSINVKRQQRSSGQVLCDVVFALYIRELKTRFGVYRLGLVWAFLEPMSFVIILSAIRTMTSTGHIFSGEVHSIPTPLFFMLGYVPYQLFSKLLTQSATAITSNRGLFSYRQVKPIDTLLARTMLEVLISVGVMFIIMAFFWWFQFDVKIQNPLQLITTLSLLICIGFGMGTALCVGQLRFPELAKLVPIITRPLFFISGIFFSLNDIPEKFHQYLLWNPILHAVELIRNACYSDFRANYVSMQYLAFFSLLTLFFGLALYRNDWKRMVAS